MKYSEAKSRIKDLLESKYGDEWRNHYRFEEWASFFFLSKRDNVSKIFKPVLCVNGEDSGRLKVSKLGRSEKLLDDIFMELEEREEEKKYVVKVWDQGVSSRILVKDRSGLFDIMQTTFVNISDWQDGEPVYQVAFTKKEIDLLKDALTLNIDWDKAVEEYDGEI